MKIVLLEDINTLGNAGDVVTVKDGYGRNFLVPTGKALIAAPGNLKMLADQKRVAASKAERAMKTHRTFAQRLAKVEVVAKMQTGEDDRMFGAVTTADIAEMLGRQGIDIDRRLIQLDEPIKALGVYNIPVKLHADVEARIKVKVEKVEKAEKTEKTEKVEKVEAASAAEAAPVAEEPVKAEEPEPTEEPEKVAETAE